MKTLNIRREMRQLNVDGISNIFRSKWPLLQIMWILIFGLSTSACLLLIVLTFMDYAKYEVSTSIRYLHESESVFPTVSICNRNPFSTNYALELFDRAGIREPLLNLEVEDYLHSFAKMLVLERHTKNTTGKYLSYEAKKNMSDLNAMLVSCLFHNKPCSADDFQYIFHPFAMNCYRFNAGFDSQDRPRPLEQTSIEGFTNRLTLVLYAGLPDGESELRPDRGFYVFIHNATDSPYFFTPTSYLITPGLGAAISVKRLLYNQYRAPWSECTVLNCHTNELSRPIADPSYFNQVINVTGAYSRASCILYCAQKHINKHFNCNAYFIKFYTEGLDYCLGAELETDIAQFYFGVFSKGDFIRRNCYDYCPLECTQSTFEHTLSFFKYPPSQVYINKTLRRRLGVVKSCSNQTDFKERLADNLVKISIFYDTLSYVQVEEWPKVTWMDLIGTLGGHLHMFLGISLLSFVEIFELVIIYVTMRFSTSKHKLGEQSEQQFQPPRQKKKHWRQRYNGEKNNIKNYRDVAITK